MKTSLVIAMDLYETLRSHLLPTDDKEAVAFILCGLHQSENGLKFLAHEIYCVPYEKCICRENLEVVWPTKEVVPMLDKAEKNKMALVKIHSHRADINEFSEIDSDSDRSFIEICNSWIDAQPHHASAIMLKDGKVIGRKLDSQYGFVPFDCVTIVGDDIRFMHGKEKASTVNPEYVASQKQAFGSGTTELLNRLSIAVVGCSGLGSVTVEQLARLGAGTLVLIDSDVIENRNLNRIIHSTPDDAKTAESKVNVMKRAIDAMGFGTTVRTFACDLANPEAISAVADCDIAFGCVDGAIGRHLLNRLCTYYSIPYFDIGIKLQADGKGGIDNIVGSVHYFRPGTSSFFTRKVFTPEMLRSESVRKSDPEHYKNMEKEKYIIGVQENSPAVISVNMLYSALGVNEFLARIHKFRLEENSEYESHTLCLSNGIYEHRPAFPECETLRNKRSLGDVTPILGLPTLSTGRKQEN